MDDGHADRSEVVGADGDRIDECSIVFVAVMSGDMDRIGVDIRREREARRQCRGSHARQTAERAQCFVTQHDDELPRADRVLELRDGRLVA